MFFRERPRDKFSGLVAGLSGRRRLPRPSCLVKYNNMLLSTNAVKFHIIIVYLFCFVVLMTALPSMPC